MTIIMTKPEFKSLPESEQWAIVYNLEPKPQSQPEPTQKPEPTPKTVLPTVEGFWN
jgi:hypothetical protein